AGGAANGLVRARRGAGPPSRYRRHVTASRTLRALAVSTALLAVGAALASCASSAASGPPPPSRNLGQTMDAPVPDRIMQLPLTTSDGKPTNLAAYHGKIVLLTDFLTLCSDACPLVSQELADIDHRLVAAHLQDKVELVELTVDPQRDTPARLAAYRKLFDP